MKVINIIKLGYYNIIYIYNVQYENLRRNCRLLVTIFLYKKVS